MSLRVFVIIPVTAKRNVQSSIFQPEAVVFSDIGPDHRWVGNEKGLADSDASTCYTPCVPESETEPVPGYTCYRERKTGTY